MIFIRRLVGKNERRFNMIFSKKPEIVIQEFVKERKSWEEIVQSGMLAREAKDNSQWLLGDLAVEVETFFPGKLEEFASKIGVNKETLRRYKTVSLAWPPSTRLKFLSHRHHQILASRSDRREWLEKAHDNSWSCEALMVELKKADGKWDEKLAVASMSFSRGEIEEISRWYRQILEKWPEKLNEFSHIVYDKVKRFLKKTEKV